MKKLFLLAFLILNSYSTLACEEEGDLEFHNNIIHTCRVEPNTNNLVLHPEVNNQELAGFLRSNRANPVIQRITRQISSLSVEEYSSQLDAMAAGGRPTTVFRAEDEAMSLNYISLSSLYNRGGGGVLPTPTGPETETDESESPGAEGGEPTETENGNGETEQNSEVVENEAEETESPTEEAPDASAIFEAMIQAGPSNISAINQARLNCASEASPGEPSEASGLQSFQGSWSEGTNTAAIMPLSYTVIRNDENLKSGILRYYKEAVIVNGEVVEEPGVKQRRVTLHNGKITVEDPRQHIWEMEFSASTTEDVAKLRPTEGENLKTAECYLAEKIPTSETPSAPAPQTPTDTSPGEGSTVTQ